MEFWKQLIDCSAICFVVSPSFVSFCSHINSIWSFKKRQKRKQNKTTKDRKETPSVSLPRVSRTTVQLLLCKYLHHHHRRHHQYSLASGGRKERGLKICPGGRPDRRTERQGGERDEHGREEERKRLCLPSAAAPLVQLQLRPSTATEVRLLQHGVQLVGQVVKHAADVVEDANCRLLFGDGAAGNTGAVSAVRWKGAQVQIEKRYRGTLA